MADYESKPNSISIFVNAKRTKETAPNLNGSVCIPVQEYNDLIVDYVDAAGVITKVVRLDISLWGKKSKEGTTYWSGNIRKPFVRTTDENSNELPPHDANAPGTDPDNDLPF